MEKIWDSLDKIPFRLNEYGIYNLIDTNLENVPIGTVEIERSNALDFTLTIHSDYYDRPRKHVVPGSITMNDTFLLVQLGPYRVRFEYLSFQNFDGDSESNTAKTEYRFSNIEIDQMTKDTPSYLMEWFYVSSDFGFIFPDNLNFDHSDSSCLRFKSEEAEWMIEIGGSQQSRVSSSVFLNLLGHQLFIFNWSKTSVTRIGILYRDSPEWEDRKKISDVLSFTFGARLVFLGEADLTEGFVPIRTMHRSFFGNTDALLSMPCLPPMILGREREGAFDANIICSKALQNTSSGILDIYDKYNLKFTFHLYTYGRTLPYYLSAGVLGGAFESLLNTYYSLEENKLKGNILPRNRYRALRKAVTDQFEELGIEPDECRQIKNKIPFLNQISFKQKADRLFTELGIQFGEIEKSAWKSRNDSAHGNYFHEANVPNYIKDARVIAGLTNRAVLALSNNQRNLYFDYSSINFALRELQAPQLKES